MTANFEIHEGVPVSKERLLRFKQMIRARGLTMEKLATLTDTGRTHLSLVISGRRSGIFTWRKLDRVLLWEERQVLRGTFSEDDAGKFAKSVRQVRLRRRRSWVPAEDIEERGLGHVDEDAARKENQ